MEVLESAGELLREFWPHLVVAISTVLTAVASAHIVLHKKDTRAAIGWIGVVVMSPIFGAILYTVFGINRVQPAPSPCRRRSECAARESQLAAQHGDLAQLLGPNAAHLCSLEKLIGTLTDRPLVHGNRVRQLVNGDEAYPEMLAAIESAEVGRHDELHLRQRPRRRDVRRIRRAVRARRRGPRADRRRRLAIYFFPSIVGRCTRAACPSIAFCRRSCRTRFAYANLRNHRKILVVDGRVGFTGGLNIREGHDLRLKPAHPIQDHALSHRRPRRRQVARSVCRRLGVRDERGPARPKVVSQRCRPWGRLARGITTARTSDLDKLQLALIGALGQRQSSVCIVTPLFPAGRTR